MNEIALDREALIKQNIELVEIAKQYYDETMEYHNFEGHILGTWETTRRLAQLCIESGIDVDVAITDRAVLFHDADVHKPPIKRYATLERRSAAINRRELRLYGDNEETVRHSSKAIIATTYGEKPTTIESAIVKRADIINVGQDYKTFITNSIRVLREQFRLRGLNFTHDSIDAWIKTTAAYLTGYLRDDEPFGEFDLSEIDPKCSVFKSSGLQNINLFLSETYGSIMGKLHGESSESSEYN